MNAVQCEWVRDRVADREAGRLGEQESLALDSHIAGCADCAVERDAIRLVACHPVPLPVGLEARVLRAVHAPGRPRIGRPVRLGLAASIVFALLAGGIVWKSGISPGVEEPAPATGEAAGGALLAWPMTGDPLLHGGTSLHELSVDELEVLLKELES
jgi:hypothetical protein